MGNINLNPGVYKETKYIKIPDRRLISGLLYINVVNDIENDSQEDFIQQCSNKYSSLPDEIKYSNPFNNNSIADRGRTSMKHSFADYDCFVFHVAGGMTLTSSIASPTGVSFISGSSDLFSNGYISPLNTWIDSGASITSADTNARWYEYASNPFGDYCSHFIKYHLLSRINNASGHALSSAGSSYYKHRPVLTKAWKQDVQGDCNSADAASVTNSYILSHGTYDTNDVLGNQLGSGSIVKTAVGNSSNGNFVQMDNDADGNEDGNTYFSPVDNIRIYGKHNIVVDSHSNSSGNKIWSMTGENSVHETDFWSLVIEIGLRGNNPGGSTGFSAPDKSLFKSKINISFQPFGETANFDISDTFHT